MFMCVAFSCTTNDEMVAENSEQSVMLRKQRDINAMAAYFKDSLWQSNEYRALKEKRIKMTNKINKPSKESDFQSVKTKAEFHTWIEENMTSTEFQSISEADELWDAITYDIDTVLNNHSDFFSDLGKCSQKELSAIFAPEIQEPWTNIVAQHTEQDCLDLVSGWFADASNNFDSEMGAAAWYDIGTIAAAYIHYDSAIKSGTESFNNCIDSL